ncbi:MAG: transposase [Nanoarchaeota archaeon]
MKKRKSYTREFKLSILNELALKKPAEVSREHNLHPTVLSKWKREFKDNPKKAFKGNGNLYKAEAETEKYKRLVGQLYAENEFLKKNLRKLQQLKAEQEKTRCIK